MKLRWIWLLAAAIVGAVVPAQAATDELTFRNGSRVSISKSFPKSRGCCQKVDGVITAVDNKFAVFSDGKCEIKWCQVPAKAASIWVCGCPGRSCYGINHVDYRSPQYGSIDGQGSDFLTAEQLLQVDLFNTEALYRMSGYPVKVALFGIPKPKPRTCGVKGIRITYPLAAIDIGVTDDALATQELSLRKGEGVMRLEFKKSKCFEWMAMTTNLNRTITVGNPRTKAVYSSARPRTRGSYLAAVSAAVDKTGVQSINLLAFIWGFNHCPLTYVPIVSKSPPPAPPQALRPPATPARPGDVAGGGLFNKTGILLQPPGVVGGNSTSKKPTPPGGPPSVPPAVQVKPAFSPVPSSRRPPAPPRNPASRDPTNRYPSCMPTDPQCGVTSGFGLNATFLPGCYCLSWNGVPGASCPEDGVCLGACCATSGRCPPTGDCGDLGLRSAGDASCTGDSCVRKYHCVPPKGRYCDPRVKGTRCMGYTTCKKGQPCDGTDNNAACLYRTDASKKFDVCTCRPIFPITGYGSFGPS